MVGPPKSHILETDVDGDISLYDAHEEQVTVLNGTASDIWRLADGEHTVDQMTELLASAYGVPPESITQEVSDTVRRLAEAGLLEKP